MPPKTSDWFEKMPSLRGDPQDVVNIRIERHNELRHREHLIRLARRYLLYASWWPTETAYWFNRAAECRREAASIRPDAAE